MIELTEQIVFDQLREILGRLSLDATEATIRDNLALVRSIGRPSCVLSLLEEVMRDRSLIREIAGRSYRHVNHFDKIVLIDSDNEQSYRLTLHLWNPPYSETELQDELIHDHRFSFWSTVLTGDLVSENFNRSEKGNVYRQYRYIPEVVTHNFYEFVGEAMLAKTQPSQRTAGETYYLWYESIHRVILPQTSRVCTMVLRGPRQRNHSNVYNTTYPRENTRTANVVFSESQTETKLAWLLDAVVKRLGADQE
jgi:hypothetical protein